jgi:hypothetical protein
MRSSGVLKLDGILNKAVYFGLVVMCLSFPHFVFAYEIEVSPNISNGIVDLYTLPFINEGIKTTSCSGYSGYWDGIAYDAFGTAIGTSTFNSLQHVQTVQTTSCASGLGYDDYKDWIDTTMGGEFYNLQANINTYSLSDGVYWFGFPVGDNTYYFYFTVSDGDLQNDSGLYTTISTVTPHDLTIHATSTTFTFGATGYLYYTDLSSTTVLRITYYNNGLASIVASPSVVSHVIEFPITDVGFFSFSTTTSLTDPLGVYYMKTEILDSSSPSTVFTYFSCWIIESYCQGSIITASSTEFDLSSTTSLAYYNNGDAITKWGNNGSEHPEDYGTTVSTGIEFCNINPFSEGGSLLTTIECLFKPTGNEVQTLWSDARDNVFSIFPLGYFTRFIVLIALPTPVEPPPLSYSFGSSSPTVLRAITASDPIYFQPWDRFDELESIRSDQGNNKNLWDIVDIYFTIAVSFATLVYILNRLIGLEIYDDRATDQTSITDHHSVREVRTGNKFTRVETLGRSSSHTIGKRNTIRRNK